MNPLSKSSEKYIVGVATRNLLVETVNYPIEFSISLINNHHLSVDFYNPIISPLTDRRKIRSVFEVI